jgi:hypothetical protein
MLSVQTNDRATNAIDKTLYAQVAIVFLTLLFILLASTKYFGEKTTYQTLPVVGLSLILLSGFSDIAIND